MGDFVKTGLGKNTQDAKYYDKPEQALGAANLNLANDNYGAPGMSFSQSPAVIGNADTIPPAQLSTGDFPNATQPRFLNAQDNVDEVSAPSMQGGGLKPNFVSNNTQLPTLQKPSFDEASATGKGLTKKGLLFDLLMGAGQGAAAGWGAWDPGQGYARGAAAGSQRRLAFLQQKKQAQEDKRLAEQDARQQAQLDQNAAENKSQAELRAQQIKESEARVGAKEKTPQEVYKEDVAAGLSPEEAKQHAYKITPSKGDTNISPYEDFRSGYPSTPEGRQQAVREYHKLMAKQPGNKAASHADQLAEAEDIAGSFLDRANGDPNKAMELFVKAGKSVKDKRQLLLAPHIRNAIRGSRRVQNVDPLAGIFNNNSPQ